MLRLITHHFSLITFFVVSLTLFSLPISASEKTNVILIVSDDLTAKALGAYGNEVCRTPNLDRLAGEGVTFTRTYCQYPVCGASRASFMSGLYPATTRMMGNSTKLGAYRNTNPRLADHPSIGGFFRQNGYVSLRVSKIYHMGVPGGIELGEPGGDDPDSWDYTYDVLGPETLSPGKLELLTPKRKHYGSNFARIVVPDEFEETQADALAATQAIAILENRGRSNDPEATNKTKLKPEAPFFLGIGFVRPHVPLVAPERIFDHYPEEEAVLPIVPEDDLADVPKAARITENAGRFGMSELQQKQTIAAYYASVEYMDEQVGRILETLDRLDLRENTVVAFISDHGYNLGEHHCWQKTSLWEDSARVPLIVSAPGFEDSAGTQCDALTELIDLYPTFADLAGLADQSPENLQGLSLRPLLEEPGRSDWPKKVAWTVTQGGRAQGLRTPRWRYSFWSRDPEGNNEELYDHDSDPGESANLAKQSDHATRLSEMRQLLEQMRSRYTP